MLDPGAGDGSFLVAALRLLSPDIDDVSDVCRVRGLEIHEDAVREARDNVADALLSMGWSNAAARSAAFAIVVHADYLVDGCGDFAPDLIAGNPPYMRFARLPDAFKAIYGAILPKLARNDLQHAFLDRCRADLVDGGAIAFVTADRWLFNDTAGPLRAALGERFSVAHLERLDVDSCFYRPKSRRKGTPPRVHPVEIVLSPHAEGGRRISSRAIAIEDTHDVSGPTLADVADVRLGPYVGPLGGFLLDGRDKNAFPDDILVPAIDTNDIDFRTGTVEQPSKWVIRLGLKDEPEGHLREHLLKWRPKMPKKTRAGKWWRTPENVDLPIDRPCLIIPRIAKGITPIRYEGGALPINHNLMIVTDAVGTGLDRIQEWLLSEEVQAWARNHAPRLETGYIDIKTGLLRRIPCGGLVT